MTDNLVYIINENQTRTLNDVVGDDMGYNNHDNNCPTMDLSIPTYFHNNRCLVQHGQLLNLFDDDHALLALKLPADLLL